MTVPGYVLNLCPDGLSDGVIENAGGNADPGIREVQLIRPVIGVISDVLRGRSFTS